MPSQRIKMPRGKKAHPFSCKLEKRDPPCKCKCKMCRQKKGPQCKYVLDEYVLDEYEANTPLLLAPF
jgi:hypothetical protein